MKDGAPEEIRTPDPQIRSLWPNIVIAIFSDLVYQYVYHFLDSRSL
jgi:hypothetical protein